MKLSNTTIEALKNLADLNQGIFIEAGNVLRTQAENKQMFGEITVPDSFPIAFGIYNLKKLITILSVYENPEIEFDTQFLTLSNGRMTTEYGYTDKSNILTPPDGEELSLPSVDIKFDLPKADLKTIMSVSRAMEYLHVALVSDGNDVVLQCFDVYSKAARSTSVKMGFTSDHAFHLIFTIENISKMLLDDYVVEVSKTGIARFKGKDKTYFIMLHKDSTYDK
jgi:hypothetical protein